MHVVEYAPSKHRAFQLSETLPTEAPAGFDFICRIKCNVGEILRGSTPHACISSPEALCVTSCCYHIHLSTGHSRVCISRELYRCQSCLLQQSDIRPRHCEVAPHQFLVDGHDAIARFILPCYVKPKRLSIIWIVFRSPFFLATAFHIEPSTVLVRISQHPMDPSVSSRAKSARSLAGIVFGLLSDPHVSFPARCERSWAALAK